MHSEVFFHHAKERVAMPNAQAIPAEEINNLVDRFYAKVRLDPEIGPIFNAAVDDWPAHLSLLKDFWSTVLLTERRYKGDPLAKHLELSLDPQHFARWLALFEETAREVMEPQNAEIVVAKSHRIADNFKLAIAHNRGEKQALPIFRAPVISKY
jgi:hemoglobin